MEDTAVSVIMAASVAVIMEVSVEVSRTPPTIKKTPKTVMTVNILA